MDKPIIRWEVDGIVFFAAVLTMDEEVRQAGALRYKVFVDVEVPRLPPENYLDGVEFDQYDPTSIHIGAWVETGGGALFIGYVRLMPCDVGYFLGHAVFDGVPFELPRVHEGRPVLPALTAEVSRLVAFPFDLSRLVPGSGKRVLVSMLLFEALLAVSKRRGYKHWVYGAVVEKVDHMRDDGWPFVKLIPDRIYYSELSEVGILALNDYNYRCRRYVT